MNISIQSNILEHICDVDVGDVVVGGGDEAEHVPHTDKVAGEAVGLDLHGVPGVPGLDLVTADGHLEDAVGAGIGDG